MRLSARTGPFRWRFSARYARICTRWPCRRNLWKNASETSNIKSASWVICVPALCRSSTTSAATPIVAAKPIHPSNMALITKSVLPGTARAPAKFVREEDLDEVKQQLENYRQLRQLVDEWITLSAELSGLRLREKRGASNDEIKRRKSRIPK